MTEEFAKTQAEDVKALRALQSILLVIYRFGGPTEAKDVLEKAIDSFPGAERTREISREEWDERNPGREAIVVKESEDPDYSGPLFHRNITHNLNRMAADAGVYQACWRPEEIGASTAADLVPLLREGLSKLRADPERFRALNPANGWGSYEGLVEFVETYLEACERFPHATVRVSR